MISHLVTFQIQNMKKKQYTNVVSELKNNNNRREHASTFDVIYLPINSFAKIRVLIRRYSILDKIDHEFYM